METDDLANWANEISKKFTVCLVNEVLSCSNEEDRGLAWWGKQEHPGIRIQSLLNGVFCPTSPTEIYSDAQPTLHFRKNVENDWRPIDEVYGTYDFKSRTITIFWKNIKADASRIYSCDPHQLEYLVRLHEYGHALVHLGIFEGQRLLRKYAPGSKTDWEPFLRTRDTFYKNLDTSVHELLAQAICWACLDDYQRGLFDELMKQQPPEYHLSDPIKNAATKKDQLRTILYCLQDENGLVVLPTGQERPAVEQLLLASFPKPPAL